MYIPIAKMLKRDSQECIACGNDEVTWLYAIPDTDEDGENLVVCADCIVGSLRNDMKGEG